MLFALLLAAAQPAYGSDLNARVFDRAWMLVDKHYWDRDAHATRWADARDRYRPRALAATSERGLYAVLGEMLGTLGDSHVFADDPDEVDADEAREGGGRGGFGFASWQSGDSWRVFAVDADTPAAAAGVQIGWRLLSIDGRPVDVGFHPAPGESASIVFEDEGGRRHALRLTAAALPPAAEQRATRLPGDILVLRLDGFDGRPDRWITDEIDAARPRAVILDLRENYGGEAMSVARVAGRLFTEKQTLIRRIGRKGPENVPTLGAGDRSYAGPLAILVGPRSASGAEAIAAAVQETGRGITVGERTAGALTGAARYRLPDGGELSVAEFDIRTGHDARLEGRGLTPGVVVTPALADLRAGRDPVLEKARALLAGRSR